MALLAILIGLIFVYGLVSGRLERTVLTSPIVFTAAGIVLLIVAPRLGEKPGSVSILLRVAEAGLVLLLFTDASRTDLKVLKSIRNLPVRLLSVGMLLTILLGGLGALVLLRALSIWEAGILAAILAPTDAGLGQVIVSSPRVPLAVRQALNVEAGLNDGLSVPFLLFFLGLAESTGGGQARLSRFLLEQLGFGAAIGLGIGLAGGWLLGVAERKKWMAPSFRQIGVVALPLLCAVASEAAGASMFIAAFAAGLAVQVGFPGAAKDSVEFTELWGQLLNLSVFFLFGLLVARSWHGFMAAMLAYAVYSLTLARMLPVALALIGTHLSRASVVFMGWFGPRGLASIVLGLVYLEREAALAGESTIRLTVMATVLLSIFAHGLSAMPGIDWYARRIAALDPSAPEFQAAGEPSPRS
ncbi:MAG TPA: cation:proton antiporter [Thermoanaerobaculia bacterium]|nr:cation:proton antiporter [Thermoanaerobaculia bacterium]